MVKTGVMVVISIIFITFRIKLDSLPIGIQFVGAINILALIYVIIDIISGVKVGKTDMLLKTSLPEKTKKERRRTYTVICGVISIISILGGTAYFTKYASSMWNDIIAIIALCFSFVRDEFVHLLIRLIT